MIAADDGAFVQRGSLQYQRGGEAFHRIQPLLQDYAGERLHDDVDVVGHDDEITSPHPLAVEVQQRIRHKAVRFIQHAASVAVVEFDEELPLLLTLECSAMFERHRS